MGETIIVGVIIAAAAAFTVYRLFFKPKCGCGGSCGCETQTKEKADPFAKSTGCCGGNERSCNCNK